MTADRHPWVGGTAEEFDYSAMAAAALDRISALEKGLAKLKRQTPAAPFPGSLIHSRILLLEEELMEQRSLYKLFCRKAEERSKDATD